MSKDRQKFIPPSKAAHLLTLIAGPLGNPGDITERALACLRDADLIFCEDTRKTLPLLSAWQIDATSKKFQSLPGQSEQNFDFSNYLNFSRWVLMSDAGTPVVNDPGATLLSWARSQNFQVEALPGPCAPILLWQWTGGFGLPFCFGGFVPKSKTKSDLDHFFASATSRTGSFCFFDTRHQIINTLEYLSTHELWRDKSMYLGREMTKTHQELLFDVPEKLKFLLQERIDNNEGVGELTLLMPAIKMEKNTSDISVQDLLKIRSSSPKDAAKIISKLTGQSVKTCYDQLVEK